MLWTNYTILAEKILEYRKELQDIMNGAETDVSIERLASWSIKPKLHIYYIQNHSCNRTSHLKLIIFDYFIKKNQI